MPNLDGKHPTCSWSTDKGKLNLYQSTNYVGLGPMSIYNSRVDSHQTIHKVRVYSPTSRVRKSFDLEQIATEIILGVLALQIHPD